MSSFDEMNDETPRAQTVYPVTLDWDSDKEGDEDDELENTSSVPSYANTISYQKRQALGEFCRSNLYSFHMLANKKLISHNTFSKYNLLQQNILSTTKPEFQCMALCWIGPDSILFLPFTFLSHSGY